MAAAPAEPTSTVLRATAEGDLDAAVEAAIASGAHLAVCAEGAVPPGVALACAAGLLDADHGVASVSLLDRAGLAALEAAGGDGAAGTGRSTTSTINTALQRAALQPLSLPAATGPAVILSHHALSRVPALPPGPTASARLAAWSAATGSRALTHLLDPSSVIERAGAGADPVGLEGLDGDDPAVAQASLRIRVALQGMRVHIDGRTLEGEETGTEVHTLQLIRALARRPEIAYLGVNLRAGIPPYAAAILADPRVHVIEGCGEWSPSLPRVDVFHRPYQPLSKEDCELWRGVGARTACHMQDLITYLSTEYHTSTAAWHQWRRNVSRAVGAVDGVFTLSDYVRHQVLREGMRGEPDLVWSAPCGVDHMTDGAGAEPPDELRELRRPFALVLGSTYGHKNVDLALAAVDDARSRGVDLVLVTAGRQVERAHGGVGPATGEAIHLGRNVTSAERNWLLANASVVVFATSAEGFGLVPFEAAACGSPTVCVTFGALAEHLGELPVDTPDWSVTSFSRSIAQIVTDPDAARAQVTAVRRAATELTWDRTAATVLRGYQELLRRPARG